MLTTVGVPANSYRVVLLIDDYCLYCIYYADLISYINNPHYVLTENMTPVVTDNILVL